MAIFNSCAGLNYQRVNIYEGTSYIIRKGSINGGKVQQTMRDFRVVPPTRANAVIFVGLCYPSKWYIYR